jgi:hypothetical protein
MLAGTRDDTDGPLDAAGEPNGDHQRLAPDTLIGETDPIVLSLRPPPRLLVGVRPRCAGLRLNREQVLNRPGFGGTGLAHHVTVKARLLIRAGR